MLTLETWVYDQEKGEDVPQSVAEINFTPSEYPDCASAALAFFNALNSYAIEEGYSNHSVSIITPVDAAERGYDYNYVVSWEDGPYQWGRFITNHLYADNWYTEPRHSFDVCFVKK